LNLLDNYLRLVSLMARRSGWVIDFAETIAPAGDIPACPRTIAMPWSS